MSDQVQIKQSFGVGSMIGRSFSQFFANFRALMLVILVPHVVMALFETVIAPNLEEYIGYNMTFPRGGIGSTSSPYPPAFWWMLLVTSVASYVIWGAAVLAVHGGITRRKISIIHCFKQSILKFLPILVLGLVQVMFAVLIVSPIFLIISIFSSDMTGLIGSILMAFIIAYVFACFLPLSPVILVGNAGWSGLSRAADLTRGYRWPIVGLLAILMAVALVALIVIGIAVGLGMSLITISLVSNMSSFVWISSILSGLLSALMTGYSCTLVVVIYLRLLEIKEGYSGQDLEQVFQ